MRNSSFARFFREACFFGLYARLTKANMAEARVMIPSAIAASGLKTNDRRPNSPPKIDGEKITIENLVSADIANFFGKNLRRR